jgi:hypothetical protein
MKAQAVHALSAALLELRELRVDGTPAALDCPD